MQLNGDYDDDDVYIGLVSLMAYQTFVEYVMPKTTLVDGQ